MQIQGITVLVTGATRGIGRGFVTALLERGARRIYATARNPDSLDAVVARAPGQVIPIELDVTDQTEVSVAARVASDVTLLINNGGIAAMTGFLAPPTLDGAREEMEVNFWGQLAMVRAFAPILKANGGGGIIQVLSIGALFCAPSVGTYCASKFAANAMCQGLRAELAPQRTHVMGVCGLGAVGGDERLQRHPALEEYRVRRLLQPFARHDTSDRHGAWRVCGGDHRAQSP